MAPEQIDRPVPIPERERARGHFAAPADMFVDGLTRQRRYIGGDRRPPPIHHLTGMGPTHIAPGRSTFSMPLSPWLYGPLGIVPGGVLALLADAPLSGAIISELGAGRVVTTAELSIAFVQPAAADAERITAVATTIHAGGQLGLSSCEVTDGSGRLLAHASARNVILDAPGDPERSDDEQSAVDEAASSDGPDPWQRPVEGEILPLDVWEARTGLELSTGWCAGELPTPPIGVLTGTRPREAEEGAVVWTAPTSRWWCSPAPFLYGGMLANFAEAVLSSACLTVAPRGQVPAALDLTVRFLRPVFPDSGELRATAEVAHRGRSLLVARGAVAGPDGKTAVLAEASAALVSPAALVRGHPPPVPEWDVSP